MTAHQDREVVYLDVDDDITTVIDKLESAKDKAVTLVLPKRFATLQSIVNMRLLARSAKSGSKDLALVTNEAPLLPLAGAAGIAVAKNLNDTPEVPPSPVMPSLAKPEPASDPDAEVDSKDTKLDYHRSIGGLAAAGAGEEPPETIPLEDQEEPEAKKPAKAAKDKKLRVPNFEKFRLLLAAGIAGFILLIIFIILAIFVWPKATIILKAEATPISANLSLTTSDTAKTLDEENGIIPASLQKSDLTSNQQVNATGQQNNGDKATGSIVINGGACGPTVPSSIPAGTGVAAGNNLFFTTQSTASFSPVVSGGSCKFQSNSVGITATKGGSNYNGQSSFTVSGYSATASSPTSGGTDNNVTVLSQADVNGAKSKISEDDKNKFEDNFKKQLDSQGYYLISATFKASDPAINASPAVGQPASTASVTIKITYSVLALKKDDLKKAVTDELNKEIDKSKQKIGTDDVLKDLTINVESQSSPTKAVLNISEKTTAIPIIDEDGIKKIVAGQKVGDIESALNGYPGVKNVDVKLSPFWVSKAPKKPGHIKIILQQVKTNSQP